MPTDIAKPRERPIIFSTPMIRAILDGRKTQTRRIVKRQKPDGTDRWELKIHADPDIGAYWGDLGWVEDMPFVCGMRLWVRERFASVRWGYDVELWVVDEVDDAPLDEVHQYINGEWYRRDYPSMGIIYDDGTFPSHKDDRGFSWRSPIHMPRWASRITLEITGVKVERVQAISAKDIIAEGAVLRSHNVDAFAMIGENPKCPVSAFDDVCYPDLLTLWAAGWNSLHGPGAWDRNDWVWCISFRKVDND